MQAMLFGSVKGEWLIEYAVVTETQELAYRVVPGWISDFTYLAQHCPSDRCTRHQREEIFKGKPALSPSYLQAYFPEGERELFTFLGVFRSCCKFFCFFLFSFSLSF